MGIPHFIRNDRQLDFFGSGRAAASSPLCRSFQDTNENQIIPTAGRNLLF
jgi:hypothetical protein